jgi:hypothetical protein
MKDMKIMKIMKDMKAALTWLARSAGVSDP